MILRLRVCLALNMEIRTWGSGKLHIAFHGGKGNDGGGLSEKAPESKQSTLRLDNNKLVFA